MIDFIPYATPDGVPTLRDSVLAAVYQRICEERSYRRVFFDKSVTDEDGFVKTMKSRPFSLVRFDGEVGGFFWLDLIGQHAADVHFCVFRGFYGAAGISMGKRVLLYLGQVGRGEWPLSVVYGKVPANNPLAARYALTIGMCHVGVLPMYFHDAFDDKLVDANVFAYEFLNEGV